MTTDLCPGYRHAHYADGGLCCCGLYWIGLMPMHTERGAVVRDTVRYLKKLRDRDIIKLDEPDGALVPYGKGHAMVIQPRKKRRRKR